MKTCPICTSDQLSVIYETSEIPLSRYSFLDSVDEPYEKVGVSLVYCDVCSFSWNKDYDEKKVNYKSTKIIESNRFSEAYRQHLIRAKDKISKYLQIEGSTIVEIGAGACDFLELFKEAKERLAIEPSHEITHNLNPEISKINDYFREGIPKKEANLVAARQVLEHISDPMSFVRQLMQTFSGEKVNTYFYFEVPNAALTLEHGRFFDVYYDHCNYFTPKALLALFNNLGLQICDLSLDHAQEIISVIVATSLMRPELKNNLSIKKAELSRNLRQPLEVGNTLIWGAAGNGVTLLNVLGLDCSKIQYVIDKDVNKQGKFIPGTFQRIISPEEAKSLSPKTILIMSQFHRSEIEQECKALFGEDVYTI